MIVVEVKLVSAISRSRDADLGTMIIDNVSGGGSKRDYRVRMYRKGELAMLRLKNQPMVPEAVLSAYAKPIRQATVLGHRAEAEPVHNLVAKALTAMGYK